MFVQALREQGIDEVKVIKKDIGNEIRRERKEMQRSKARSRRALHNAMNFDDKNYHSYQDMVDFMVKLAEQKPDLVQLLNITNSFEGRRIYGVRIRKQAPIKPSILVDAGVHAREWIAPAVALHMIKKLVTSYDRDPKITRMINKFDWYIIPQVNPDGYEYSRTKDRLWRKTRSLNSTVNKWCTGTDANRNWGYRWGEVGANRSPCSNIYAGSRPYSEPEVAGLKDFITWNIPNLQIYVSLHSYGQLFLSPWGYTMQKPSNYWDQRNAARAAVIAMKNATGVNYNFGSISEIMYPASGTSIDYMQHRGVPYIYGVELRPLDSINGYAFSLPPRYIEPTGDEMLAGLLAIAEYAVVQKRL
ncbi:hypothetical protein WR25_05039 [Diploscapter pachys]|uniref:Peptidase M14 domain-containing protein n=1 Tax=Diploscapter pachys TaxID=2018661 RepID=A0A2A2J5C7_9BILA|nr:hypothetical protein WR25_05039 [Diploscapter pachys]